ncbi:MAG: SH3 domain-containing protein [Leptolyngbya sp. RL_3_1]|nr:SH3 domain-containing protein [Leptolyngbya sp. RL_3_1]
MASNVLGWGLLALAVTLTGCYPSAIPSTDPSESPSEVTNPVEESLSDEAETEAPRQATVLETNNALAGETLPNPQVTRLIAQDPDAQINIRADPDVNAAVIDTGGVGDGVEVLRITTAADDNDWYYIRSNDETSGWVRSDFVAAISPVTVPAAATGQDGEDVLSAALDSHCGGSQSIAAYYQTENFIVYVCIPRNRPPMWGTSWARLKSWSPTTCRSWKARTRATLPAKIISSTVLVIRP